MEGEVQGVQSETVNGSDAGTVGATEETSVETQATGHSYFQEDLESGLQHAQDVFELTEQPEWVPVILDEMRTGWTQQTAFELWGTWYLISILFCLLCLAGVIYCWLRILQIRRQEWATFRKAAHTVTAEDVPRTKMRWQRVMEHAQSDDEHKWRLAILEADIMLNELLDLQGYKGETIAEKMKQVPRSQFNTIDDAWEAHKVRNKVAHEGVEYTVTEREKSHVINLYQRVFKEFGFI